MPEYGERHAHLITGRHFLKTLGKNTKVLSLRGDSSSKDTCFRPKHLHAFEFGPESHFVRGPKSAQTHVVPDETLRSATNPSPPHISELDYVWEDVQGNGRAIFLVFNKRRVFEFHWLTHSSIQLYTRHVWEESVMRVDREHRGFRIAIAFEFKDYFLSFNSIDLVVKPVWRTLTPAQMKLTLVERLRLGIDVYRDFAGFLEAVANWILDRPSASANLIWVGVGVYTVCEIFFLAGCSPFLLEFEVFDCPSRTARLCEAFWMFAHESQTVWEDLLRGALFASINLIAPTDEQRVKYANHLYVYAKGQTAIPPRMEGLLKEYIARLKMLDVAGDVIYTRDSISDLYDVFEPTFIFDALAVTIRAKKFTLGHLIFNPAFWTEFGCGKGEAGDDKLTLMYIAEGLWSRSKGAQTFLKLEVYEICLKDVITLKPNYPRPRVYAYRASKQIWSLIPDYPDSLLATAPPPPPKNPKKKDLEGEVPRKKVTPVSKEKQKSMEFKNIIKNSNRVAIGALEYCGHGKVVKTPHNTFIPLAVYGDPRVGEHHSLLSLWSLFSGKGKSKRKLTKAQQKNLKERALAPREWKAGYDTDVESDEDEDEDDEPKPESAPAPESTLQPETIGVPATSHPLLPSTPVRNRVLAPPPAKPILFPTSSGPSLPVTPVQNRILAPQLSAAPFPSSPTLYQPSSPTVAAPSSPPKRRYEEDKENRAALPLKKKPRKVGSGLGPRKSEDKHLVKNAQPSGTPSPRGGASGPRRSKRRG